MSPVPGADELSRTKYPPVLTIKFATFSRKPTPGMMAVGGLPAEMVVHMLVSTRVPPQYGASAECTIHAVRSSDSLLEKRRLSDARLETMLHGLAWNMIVVRT